MKNAYNISKPLKYLLAKNKITAYEFSKRIGINRSITSEYVSGKKNASLARIDLFCEYFDVDRSFFTDFENQKLNIDYPLSEENEGETSILQNIKDSLYEALDDYQLSRHKKSFEKFFDMYFDTLDTDQKRDILHKMHDVVYTQQQGADLLDFNDDPSRIEKELDKLYTLINKISKDMYWNNPKMKDMNSMKVRDRIITEYKNARVSKPNVIEKSQLHIYEKGFEAGLLSSLSDDEYYRYISINKLKDKISEEIDSFSEYVLLDLEHVLTDLQREGKYCDCIKDINNTFNDLKKENLELGNREVRFFIDKLKKIKDDSLYQPASDLVWDLINKDQQKLIDDLNLLKEMLQNKIDETIRLAKLFEC